MSTKKYTTTNKITPQNYTKENVIVWFEFLSRGKINLSLSGSIIYGERKNGMRKQWLQKGKRTVAVVLAAGLALSLTQGSESSAASKKVVSLSKSKVTITAKKTKKITVKKGKGVKVKYVKWSVTKGSKVVKLSGKKKTGVTIKGLKKGTATVQAKIKVKGKLKLIVKKVKVTVKAASAQSTQATTEPSTQPSNQATTAPSTQPSNQATATPSTQPGNQATTEPSTQPTTEPTAQPTTEPTAEPTTEPSTEVENTNLKYSSFAMGSVTVTDDYYSNSLTQEVAYLKKLDEDKLLAGFKETAGYASGMTASEVKTYMGTTRYTGSNDSAGENWENSLIGGHTLGHYLTALAQAVSNPGTSADDKAVLEEKLNTIISTLKECQEKTKDSTKCEEGYIFGATLLGNTSNLEFQFDNVEKNKTDIFSEAWVPWYTMHKILAGLVSVYELTGNEDALTIAEGLGEWTYNRVSKWSSSTRTTVLNIEYGGMNDALYELAACTTDETKQEHFLEAAAQFDETTLFEKVKKGNTNCLNNLHANTTIPKFLGALNRYVVLKNLGKATDEDEVYLEYVESFWDMVVNKHTYITGGCGEWEHFGEDYVLDDERTNCNNETCASYNMLKISRMLFMITGEKKYSDYYESTLINTIMAAQNPETGMAMYFQPMKSGYFKVYSSEEEDFWCCTGSGMEDFTKLNDSIYFFKGNSVVVNQYRSSVLTWKAKNLKLTQEADLLTGTEQTFTVSKINSTKDITADTILFRIPDYAAGDVTIQVNGEKYAYEEEDGYAKVSKAFADGDVITVTIPEEVTYENLTNGDPSTVSTDVYGFKYGPFVLAAKLGSENMAIGTTGVTVNVPKSSTLTSEMVSVSAEGGKVSAWLSNVNKYVKKTVSDDGNVSFKLTGTDNDYEFVPYYQIYDCRYGIYWNFTTDESAIVLSQKTNARADKQIDVVQPGYGQNETSLMDNGSESQTASGNSRWATAGGSFSYRMLVSDTTNTTLICQFAKADNGKSIKITVGDNVIAAETLNYEGDSDIYKKYYTISKEITSANLDTSYTEGKAVKITFESNDSGVSAALYNEMYTYESIGTENSLTGITADQGTVTQDGTDYKLVIPTDATKVDVTFKLADDKGYLTVDGKAIDDSTAKEFDFTSARKATYKLRVYAEDFVTYKDYTLVIQKEYDYDPDIEYFVDCGDYNVTTLSSGDKFGVNNSVTEQVYGEDPITGKMWGIVDTVSNPLLNGDSKTTEDAAYTDQTWPFETDTTITDGADKTRTNRYTKNQWENGVSVRFLDYAFELENGTYDVEVGFCNPWNCSDNPNLYAYYGENNQVTLATKIGVPDHEDGKAIGIKTVTGTVTVTNGKLTLNARSDANDSTTLAINMTYIIIKKHQ